MRIVKKWEPGVSTQPLGQYSQGFVRDRFGRMGFECACEGCKSGYCHALPRAPCKRFQPHAPGDREGGITVEEAAAVGWRRAPGGWRCPFCSGNEEGLNRVFRKGARKFR